MIGMRRVIPRSERCPTREMKERQQPIYYIDPRPLCIFVRSDEPIPLKTGASLHTFSQTFSRAPLLPVELVKAKRRRVQPRAYMPGVFPNIQEPTFASYTIQSKEEDAAAKSCFLGAKIATPNLWLFFAYFYFRMITNRLQN